MATLCRLCRLMLLIAVRDASIADVHGEFVMKTLLTVTTFLISGLMTVSVWACGDSLYRVGKGVSYRVYTAPLPGNVLVYSNAEGAQDLANALTESGHNVELVDSELDLSLEMNTGNYDVIIASYDDHTAVEASVETSAMQPAYLPVVLSGSEAEKMAGQSYDQVMVADKDEIKHYLKAIHKSIKSKA